MIGLGYRLGYKRRKCTLIYMYLKNSILFHLCLTAGPLFHPLYNKSRILGNIHSDIFVPRTREGQTIFVALYRFSMLVGVSRYQMLVKLVPWFFRGNQHPILL